MSRTKNPVPGHYYEEYLHKKDSNDKVYKKLWVGLLGNTLCFYSNHKELRCMDSLSLDKFVSVKDSPSNSSSDYLFSLTLSDREVQFKAESMESREMWRAYIITMAELSIPQSLTLLPGPLLALMEALDKENQRQSEFEKEQKPSCFYNVSRVEAEDLLKKHPECGSLLLRPGTNPENVSVSTCQLIHGKYIVKHYKVTLEQNKYILQVDPPVPCSSLALVVNHFLKTTHNRLSPFERCNEYENKIGIYEVNNEDGEVTVKYPVDTIATKPTMNRYNIPPPIPREPPPPDTYVIPDQDLLPLTMDKQAGLPRRFIDGVPLPNQPANRLRGTEGVRNAGTPMKSGLDEELKRKLEQRRQRVE
uniref:Signal transducing adaptor family member 2 n=1 Tax=Leptobrachium leishanense TaxID=445787 RepID=A0A8C5MA66_9ANUR